MNLAFCICRIDYVRRVFDLLSMSAIPSSAFNIPVEFQESLGTLGNLKLQSSERRGMAGLIFTITLIVFQCISPEGLLRHVDVDRVGCMKGFQNLIRSGTACAVNKSAGHF